MKVYPDLLREMHHRGLCKAGRTSMGMGAR